MQRIEINKDLSKPYLLIARGLKEIKETAIKVSLSAKRTLELLQALQAREELNAEDSALLGDAIRHYQAIALTVDVWPEITSASLYDEEAITNLFYSVYEKLQNAKTNVALKSRFHAYTWITLNIGRLGTFLNNSHLSADEAQLVSETLYTPMQRMAKLKSFLEGFRKVLTADQQNLLQPVVDAMHMQADHLGHRAQRHIPEAGESMSKVAQLMLEKLEVFAPAADLEKENFDYELDDLALTISSVEFSGNFKPSLERLLHMIKADVIDQQLKTQSAEKIEKSAAMKLCQYTQDMLDAVLSKKTPDEKLTAIQKYQQKCNKTSGIKTFLKVIAAVVIAAVITVLVTAAICGIAALIGTLFGGPAGTVAGAVAGLVKGVVTGEAIGVVVASAVTGCTLSGGISHFTMFKKAPLQQAASAVTEEAKTCKPLAPTQFATPTAS